MPGAQILKHSALLIFNVRLCTFKKIVSGFLSIQRTAKFWNSSNEKSAFYRKYKISKDIWKFH